MAYLECVDGFCMSVINADYDGAYGIASDEDTVELGRLSSVEELLKPYAELYPDRDDDGNIIDTEFSDGEYLHCIYSHVPKRLVNAVIFLHGGLTFSGQAFYPISHLRNDLTKREFKLT